MWRQINDFMAAHPALLSPFLYCVHPILFWIDFAFAPCYVVYLAGRILLPLAHDYGYSWELLLDILSVVLVPVYEHWIDTTAFSWPVRLVLWFVGYYACPCAWGVCGTALYFSYKRQ